MAMMLGDDETNNSMSELSSTPAMDNNSFPPPVVDNASIPYLVQNYLSQGPFPDDNFLLPEDAYLPPAMDNNSFTMPIVNNSSIHYSLQNHMSQDHFSLPEDAGGASMHYEFPNDDAHLRRMVHKASMLYEFPNPMWQGLVLFTEDDSYLMPVVPDNSLLPIVNNASTPPPGVEFSTSVEPQNFYEDWAYMNSLDESAPGVELPALPNVMPETFGDMWDEDDIPPFNNPMSMLTLLHALDNATVPST